MEFQKTLASGTVVTITAEAVRSAPEVHTGAYVGGALYEEPGELVLTNLEVSDEHGNDPALTDKEWREIEEEALDRLC